MTTKNTKIIWNPLLNRFLYENGLIGIEKVYHDKGHFGWRHYDSTALSLLINLYKSQK